MDIKALVQKMHQATTETEKKEVENEIKLLFGSLPAAEKVKARNEFNSLFESKMNDTKSFMEDMKLSVALVQIMKYISLSQIAKDYFGKSRSWIYQRICGHKVNGKVAKFTDQEKRILSSALQDISRQINDVALKIA